MTFVAMFVRCDPFEMPTDDLLYLLSNGGLGPTHFAPYIEGQFTDPLCKTDGTFKSYATGYRITNDRGAFENWYSINWGCQNCAEVLHA